MLKNIFAAIGVTVTVFLAAYILLMLFVTLALRAGGL